VCKGGAARVACLLVSYHANEDTDVHDDVQKDLSEEWQPKPLVSYPVVCGTLCLCLLICVLLD
jgi:hypothetical protein